MHGSLYIYIQMCKNNTSILLEGTFDAYSDYDQFEGCVEYGIPKSKRG